MTIRRYIKGHVDQSSYPKSSEFTTKEELLALPWVKRITRWKTFVRFCLAKETLIAEFHDEEIALGWIKPVVVGFIEGQRPYKGPVVDLPEFETQRTRV